MDRRDLYAQWQADAGRGRQNKDRPAFVAEHADALAEHTDTDDAPPEDDLGDAREWLDQYKGTVTRQLAPEQEAEA